MCTRCSTKIGFVDTEVILKQLPEAQDADKRLKEIAAKFQDTIVRIQKISLINWNNTENKSL